MAFESANWLHRGQYILAKHGVTPAQANAALRDPNRVVIEPDYNSKSGQSVRVIGFESSLKSVVTVIVIAHSDVIYGVNAWQSNPRDKNIYEEGSLS